MMIPLSDLTYQLLLLFNDPDNEHVLQDVWSSFSRHRRNLRWTSSFRSAPSHTDRPMFLNLVRFTEQQALVCHACGVATFYNPDTMSSDSYCQGCYDVEFTTCCCCGDAIAYEDSVVPENGNSYCQSCADDRLEWCEACDGYFESGHKHGCDCEAPNLTFLFPNGDDTVAPDERVKVELPKGVIDDVGMERIVNLIYGEGNLGWETCDNVVRSIGPEWQTKRGNFTRRLSSAYHKMVKDRNGQRYFQPIPTKLNDTTISEVGNLGRQHSSDGMEWMIELTRNLNGESADFGNDRSCWWQSYYASRCALKNWGGLGLRNYGNQGSEVQDRNNPSGRAWVQPLNVDLKPTHDALAAFAYIIYNGYGDMSGYIPARIVAQMTNKTYKRVDLEASPQYINGGIGYLVADEATCAATTRVHYYGEEHERIDAADHHETRTA